MSNFFSTIFSFLCSNPYVFFLGILLFLIIFLFSTQKNNHKLFERFYSTEDIGSAGEDRVAEELSNLDDDYIVLNNCMFRIKDKTTQIDHIVVSEYGIFVIETKNYSGWIFGNEKAKYWRQSFKTEQHQFYNPVKQNHGHVYTLKYLLYKLSNIKYFPIVVFAGTAELKEINSTMPVVYEYQLLGMIKSFSDTKCISHENVKRIVQLLEDRQIDSEEHLEEHIQNIHKQKASRQLQIKKRICPKCGCTLVIRTGKYGDFYGCSNYPACHFTTNIQ